MKNIDGVQQDLPENWLLRGLGINMSTFFLNVGVAFVKGANQRNELFEKINKQ